MGINTSRSSLTNNRGSMSTNKKDKFSRFKGVISSKSQDEAVEAINYQKRIIELDMAIRKIDNAIRQQANSIGESSAELLSERHYLVEERNDLIKYK